MPSIEFILVGAIAVLLLVFVILVDDAIKHIGNDEHHRH